MTDTTSSSWARPSFRRFRKPRKPRPPICRSASRASTERPFCQGERTLSSRYAGYEKLKFDYPHPRILRVTLGVPGKLNIVDGQMHGELVEIWRDIDKDEDISAVIIAGTETGFSAGGDFKVVRAAIDDPHDRGRIWKETRDLVYNFIQCSKPIVSAMRGPAVGAGLVVGLLSDISIAAKNARLIDGHTRLGIAAGDH